VEIVKGERKIMNQLTKTLTVIILLCLTFSTFSGAIVFVQACDPASKLVFSAGTPQVLQAGAVSNKITVQLQDTSNKPVTALSDTIVNLATNASSSGHFYSDQNGKNQISGITIKEGQNSANFYYNDTLAGHPTLTASSGTLTPASTTFTINACSATKLIFSTGGSQTLNAGQVSKPIVVQRQDQYGNPTTLGGSIIISLSTNSSTGHFYSDSSGTSSITSININALASDSTSIYYADTVAGHPTLTAASAGLIAATTIFSVTSAAGGATHFVVSASSSATAGASFSISVTAKDQYGNTVTSYSGTVHFSSSDGQAVLPANSGLTSGVGTFSVTLETSGSQKVTATDTANSAITGVASLTVTAADDLAKIVISPGAASVTAGVAQAYSAEGFDQYGNDLGPVAASYSVNGNPISGSSVTETIVGSYTIIAAYGILSDSATLTVNAAPLDHLTISPIDASITAGGSQVYSVEAFDQYNNDLGSATLSATFTVNGVGISGNVVSETLAGSYNIVASEGGKSVSTTLTVNAGPLDHILINPKTATITTVQSQTYTATAYDQYGNAWTVTATYSCPDSNLIINGNSVSSIVANSYSITGSYGDKFDTATLTVTGGVPTSVVISPKSSSMIAGGSQSFSVEAFDQYGTDLGDVTGSSTFSVNGVQITSNSVSETQVGSYMVSVNYGSLSDQTTLAVTGYTVTFTNSGLPTGTAWSVTFGDTVYSSTTGTITITDVSAISYSWSTATYIQADGTRYVAAQTSGSISVPSQVSQNIDYSTQYLVTYTTTGNVLPITSPADQWINSGSTATGTFTSQVVNEAGDTRCNYLSDDRPDTIIAPTTITATYQTQYLVKYATTGNVLTITPPANEWVNSGSVATGTFTQQTINSAQTIRCNLITDNRTLITQPTTVMATYQTQYYLTITSTHGSPTQASQWVNAGSSITISVTSPDGNTVDRWICTGYSLDSGSPTSGTSYTFTNIQASHTITFTWQEQYYLTVNSPYGTPIVAGWYDSGSTAYASLASGTISGATGTQYVFTNWNGDASGSSTTSNAITMNSPKTATANWKTQYYLTVSSAYSTVNGSGWYDSGSTASATLTSGTISGSSTQYIFTAWSGDASGTALTSNSITMNSAKTATANWKTQYYLTVTSTYGTPTGQGWYDAGSAANIAVTQTVSSGTSSRNVFSAWSGSGSGAYTGSSATSSITMYDPITETASWNTQCLVTYAVTGNAITVTVPSNEWVNYGTAAKGTFSPTIANQANDTQCIFVKDNRPSTITQPTLITGIYQTQYAVNFSQNGLETDAVGTVLTILGIEKDYSQLANITWVNNGTQVTFSFANTVASTIANKLYTLTGINATSPLTIDAPTLIQANYQPQYSASLFTLAEFALIIFALLLLLLLLLAWRRRRKKKQEENKSKKTSPKPT
jgi:hypothetical protein